MLNEIYPQVKKYKQNFASQCHLIWRSAPHTELHQKFETGSVFYRCTFICKGTYFHLYLTPGLLDASSQVVVQVVPDDSENEAEIHKQIQDSKSIQNLSNILCNIINSTSELMAANRKQINYLVKGATKYIKENYYKEISLQSIAKLCSCKQQSS